MKSEAYGSGAVQNVKPKELSNQQELHNNRSMCKTEALESWLVLDWAELWSALDQGMGLYQHWGVTSMYEPAPGFLLLLTNFPATYVNGAESSMMTAGDQHGPTSKQTNTRRYKLQVQHSVQIPASHNPTDATARGT